MDFPVILIYFRITKVSNTHCFELNVYGTSTTMIFFVLNDYSEQNQQNLNRDYFLQ